MKGGINKIFRNINAKKAGDGSELGKVLLLI